MLALRRACVPGHRKVVALSQQSHDVVRQALVARVLASLVEHVPLVPGHANGDSSPIALRALARLGASVHGSFISAAGCCIRDAERGGVSCVLRRQVPAMPGKVPAGRGV